MQEVILKTKGLTKKYGKVTALNSADISVNKGDICGLIGRNGAGKTTLMKLVSGLTDATSGEFEIFGKSGRDAEKERDRIGCLIENPAFFGNMTAKQNLIYYCKQKGIVDYSQINEILKMVQLEEAQNRKFKGFSLGMKQRLGIAFAILDNPDLVILDEPINGLDPIGITQVRDTFLKLNKERGLTLMISSHILSELYATANKFLFVNNGKVVKSLTKEELDAECTKCIVVKVDNNKKALNILEHNLATSKYKVIDKNEIRIYEMLDRIPVINRELVMNGVEVSGIYESGVSLEDYFVSLVGEDEKND